MAYDESSLEGRALAEDALRIQADLEAERANWDTLYQRIAEVVFPRADTFNRANIAQGELRGEKVFDNTPGLALDRFAAALDSMLAPAQTQWHGLRPEDPDLAEVEEVKEYCEAATKVLFAARYAPKTNFASQIHEYHLSLGAFGTGGVFIDEAIGHSLRYRALHMSEIYLMDNHQGLTDRIHRKLTLKAFQIAEKVKSEGWLMPERVARALEQNKPLSEFDFVHCVKPNEEIDPRRMDHQGMAFSSYYIAMDDKMVVKEGGYRTMPYATGRYVTGPRETYGRSPAMTVLRDILMLNEMNKSVIRAAQMQLEPPMLLAEDGALEPFQLKARALNYGYVEDGKPLAVPLRPEGELAVGLEMIQDRREAVNDAFLVTLFRILVESPNMTATEALLRAQEKGQLLGPSLGRQQSEFQGAMIERELDILAMAGQLPPMPDILIENGGVLAVEFKAPINRLQRTDEAVGILRTVEALQGPAQIDPTVFDVIQWDEAARVIAEANGAPASVLRTIEEMAEKRQQRETQQNVGDLVNAAPQIGRTIKDLAQAQAIAGNTPPTIPLVQPA